MQLTFKVQGSAESPYDVVFEKIGDAVFARCSCPAGAGIFNQACKHRIGLMCGDVTALVSGNEPDVLLLQSILEGTKLRWAFDRVLAGERDVEAAKKNLVAVKKAFSRIMEQGD